MARKSPPRPSAAYLDSVEQEAKTILEKHPDLHVIIERDERGKYPVLTVRVKEEPKVQTRTKR